MACGSCGGASASDKDEYVVTTPNGTTTVTGEFAAKVEVIKAGSGTYRKK